MEFCKIDNHPVDSSDCCLGESPKTKINSRENNLNHPGEIFTRIQIMVSSSSKVT